MDDIPGKGEPLRERSTGRIFAVKKKTDPFVILQSSEVDAGHDRREKRFRLGRRNKLGSRQDHFMSVPEPQWSCSNKPKNHSHRRGVRFLPGSSDFHPEPGFAFMLHLERKRTERFRRPFLLLLLNVKDLMPGSDRGVFVRELKTALAFCVRETDIKGWYKHGKIAGIILVELKSIDEGVREKILLKIRNLLVEALGSEAVEKIRVSYRVFPEPFDGNGKVWERFKFPPRRKGTQKTSAINIPRFIMRGLDIAATLSRLVILSPVFLTNVLGIKLASKRPAFFEQGRLE